MDEKAQPAAARHPVLIGVLCGAGAAFGWAAGFVAAKHGITAGFTPADLAFHRYVWSGLLLIPVMQRTGFASLGGVGWGRGLAMTVLSGPPQAFIAYSGYLLVPLGHGTAIQPACAALFGILLATVLLHERMTAQRVFGAVAIVCGLVVFGLESLTTIGTHGVGGDLMFVTAGCFWATAGILIRHWNLAGTRVVAAVGTLSVIVVAPLYLLFVGTTRLLALGVWENVLQIVVQGILAGVLPIYLFAHAVVRLGGGRASTFPALVPIFGLIIGFATLGAVPTAAQLIGLLIVLVGFRFMLKQ
ncbi:MAG TPA: DMT family transporter [Pseudolabrys sp.]|nr:DMT family transporter [Pseudolabrys sp.]